MQGCLLFIIVNICVVTTLKITHLSCQKVARLGIRLAKVVQNCQNVAKYNATQNNL